MRRSAFVASLAAAFLFLSPHVFSQSRQDLITGSANTDNVVNYGMSYSQHRYSTLTQINKGNAKKLVPVWSLSLENELGEQGQPMVYNGVMYVANAKFTVAIEAATGKQLWRTPVNFDPETPRVVCCGQSYRGPALYNGKVYRGTLDAHMVALDQKTGKEVWKTKVAEWKEGFSIIGAPQIANGVLITGISGAEFGVRGFLDGYDLETGKRLWRRYTIPAAGEKGSDTWPNATAASRGGGSTWITGSYDPQLDLVYWGTGNAAPWNPDSRMGDNLYTASVLAIRPKTGEIVWHYQLVPNELFDLDANWEWIVADIQHEGKARKVILHMSRGGFLYVVDRTNGQLIAAPAFEKTSWASHVDMKTGRPVETALTQEFRAGKQIELWPGQWGAKNWAHAAFNPETGLLYANTMHNSRLVKKDDPGPFKVGARYVGFENLPAPREAGRPIGHIDAINPLTGKHQWRTPVQDTPSYSSMLATKGGLLFTGKATGEFTAVDMQSGQTLWSFKTPSGINAQPITFTHKGKQYVTVQSGLGGTGVLRQGDFFQGQPRNGSVWTFALAYD
jgi:alcohol dehydrogenase (cytochrome c)